MFWFCNSVRRLLSLQPYLPTLGNLSSMITKDILKPLLETLGFLPSGTGIYTKSFSNGNETFALRVDTLQGQIIYPTEAGMVVHERQTCNFAANENFVVLECVHRLLSKGYHPQHIQLEPKWKLGHGASGGRADIMVSDKAGKPLLIIECKTAGDEFEKAWKDTQDDGAQLFSYIEQEKDIRYVCLYASDFDPQTATLTPEYYLISHIDNEAYLAENPQFARFANAKNVVERYRVWRDTYKLAATQTGLFEDNMQAYQIGKTNYTLQADTKPISSTDINGKYHRFRSILRKYNVSRRENAFEVLVNLFLCKLVDELNNENDLKFYWKGAANDDYYELVDRLQWLYKIGMEKFLHQEISYVSADAIEGAFWMYEGRPSSIKARIKDLFRELKFYKGLDFEFIKVHNKETFEKNAKILIEIIELWQGLQLRNSHQNQFLGDMFENFLDNGIKQSEGQFFTPTPICKFVVLSLPVEQQLAELAEPLHVIDYACGAGHFLTEYAHQIDTVLRQQLGNLDELPPEVRMAHMERIVGIEKEDRLAKVAKVSAFMHGYAGIKIHEADALASNEAIQDGHYNLLVANPPFAVEDFLRTLPDTDRERFELMIQVGELGNKNIQCFFLERAKQLLAPNGTAGIIIPSSILSNSDAVHTNTREILLQYFDFVALVELGSNTFGKTGTNTVVLFLRRKAQRPEPADYYRERVDDFFQRWDNQFPPNADVPKDSHFVADYCQYMGIDYTEYQTLLRADPSDALLATERFADGVAKYENSTLVKNLQAAHAKRLANLPKQLTAELQKDKTIAPDDYAQTYATELAARQQQAQTELATKLRKHLVEYLVATERDKLYFYLLARHNAQKVLIVKSPTDNKEQKQFLGYEWSGAKGSEGIKYHGGDTVQAIQTPMFDPTNPNNDTKLNYIIRQNFNGSLSHIPTDLQPYASLANLTDLLDFSRADFNKAISLVPKKDLAIATKWESVKLEEFVTLIESGSRPEGGVGNISSGAFSLGGEHIHATRGVIDLSTPKYVPLQFFNEAKRGILREYDILLCKDGALTGKVALLRNELNGQNAMINEHVFIIRCQNLDSQKYLFNFLYSNFGQGILKANITGAAQGGLNSTNLKNIKIPLPPLEVQQQIVEECEAIDQAAQAAQTTIEQTKQAIEELVSSLASQYKPERFTNYVEIISGGTPKTDVAEYWNGNIPWLSVADFSSVNRYVEKTEKHITELGLKNSNTRYLEVGDLIISARGTVGALAQLKVPMTFNQSCYGLRGNSQINNGYLFYILKQEIKQLKERAVGATFGAIIKSTFDNIQIPVPPIAEQEALVAEIEQLEQRIAEAQAIITAAPDRKQAIVQRYL